MADFAVTAALMNLQAIQISVDPARWPQGLGAGSVEELAAAVLPTAPVNPVAPTPDRLALVRQLTLDPAYQLK